MINRFFQENSIKGQFARFLLVGGFTTLLNYAIFASLYFFGVNYVAASAIGYATGFFIGFVLFKKFAFKSTAQWQSEITKQVPVYGVSLLLNLSTLYALVHFFAVYPLLANVAAIGISTITNFLGMKLLVFKN